MSPRRNFLALIGGAGAVTGSVLFRKAAATPTLILPSSVSLPIARPLLCAQQNQMDAFLEIGQHVPKDMFLDWLENGLQLAERHRRSPAELARKEARIEAAIIKHGSLIAAMRAGAI